MAIIKNSISNVTNFNQNTYEKLPSSLGFISSLPTPQARDIALLSCLNACATALPGVYYERKLQRQFPHTYLYVYGPPVSGKSNVKYGYFLVRKIHETLLKEKIDERAEWAKTNVKERVASAPFPASLILQKTTSANLWKQLRNQTLSGNYFQMFNAFELIDSLGIKHGITTQDLIDIFYFNELFITENKDDFFRYKEPKMSLGISSFEEPFLTFAKKHVESGLLSRFLIYKTKRPKIKIYNYRHGKIEGLKEKIDESAEKIFQIWQTLRGLPGGIEVEFSPEFKRKINEIVKFIFDELGQKNDVFDGYAMPLAHNIVRLSMVYAALRQYDLDKFSSGKIYVDCVDFVENIRECLIRNVERAVDNVATVDLNYRGGIENEIDLGDLPLQFSTQDFIRITSLTKATAFRKLKKLKKYGLIKKIRHGIYQKTPSIL